MSRNDRIAAICELLNNAPDYALNEVQEYLKALPDMSADEVDLTKHLKKILSEDRELLHQLDQ